MSSRKYNILETSQICSSLREQLFKIDNTLLTLSQKNERFRDYNLTLRQKRPTPKLKKLKFRTSDSIYLNNFSLTRVFKSVDPTSKKEKDFLQKYFNLNSNKPVPRIKKTKLTLSKLKFPKINSKILPKATRLDPISNPIEITEQDIEKGIYSLLNLGLIPKNCDLSQKLNREASALTLQQMQLHNGSMQTELYRTSKKIIPKKSSSTNPVPLQSVSHSESIENEATNNKIPFIDIQISDDKDKQLTIDFPEDIERKKQHEENEIKAKRRNAAIRIQCCWRRYKGAATIRNHRLKTLKSNIIKKHFRAALARVAAKQYAQSLRKRRSENFRERNEFLKTNWSFIKNQEIIEINIGSDLKSYSIFNHSEFLKIFSILDPRLKLVYVSLTIIEIEIKKYYKSLLYILDSDTKKRIKFIYPSTPYLTSKPSKAFYLSSELIPSIKKNYKGKLVVLTSNKPSKYDEYISEYLNAPVLGCNLEVLKKLTKCQRRILLENSGVEILPGMSGNYYYEEFKIKFDELNINFPNRTWEIYLSGHKIENFEKWEGHIEVVVNLIPKSELIILNFFIFPNGEYEYEVALKVLGKPGFGIIFPQDLIKDKKLKSIALKLSNFLYSNSITGDICLNIYTEGIFDFEIGFSPYKYIHSFFSSLMKGVEIDSKYYVCNQEFCELEQEVYLDNTTNFVTYENFNRRFVDKSKKINLSEMEKRRYIWIWDLHHKDLIDLSMDAIFHMSRLESVLFSLAKNEGTIFLPYSNLKNGCIGIMSIGGTYENLINNISKALLIIDQICIKNREGNLNEIYIGLGIKDQIEQLKKESQNKNFLVKLV